MNNLLGHTMACLTPELLILAAPKIDDSPRFVAHVCFLFISAIYIAQEERVSLAFFPFLSPPGRGAF